MWAQLWEKNHVLGRHNSSFTRPVWHINGDYCGVITDGVCVKQLSGSRTVFVDVCGGLLFNFEKIFHWNYLFELLSQQTPTHWQCWNILFCGAKGYIG